jgi:hypothetical protein
VMEAQSFRMALVDGVNQVRTSPQFTGDKIYSTLSPLYFED